MGLIQKLIKRQWPCLMPMNGHLAEFQSWKAREMFDVVLRTQATSRGKRIFKFKEVFKRKFNPPDDQNPNGSLDKHKVRVTIAAFTKSLTEGIDYEEKNASTVRWNSTKILFAIAVAKNLELSLPSFFLYGLHGVSRQMG
jgi:hypothetical protein